MNKLSPEDIRRVIDAGGALGIVDFSIIEKDIFVTHAIHAIADMQHPGIDLIFCGGTCLAKAHQIIFRMSEDVDFKIFPKILFATHSEQRKKLGLFRDSITKTLQDAGFEINKENFHSRDNNSYIVYHLDYPTHFDQHQELKPHIQLEFTLAAPRLPTEIKSVATLVDRIFPDEKLVEKNITCISLFETAAEKWVGLTRRIAAITRGHDPMDETLVRHLYDLQSITQKIILPDDFFKVVKETIERDRTKFKRHHEYIENPIEEINYSVKIIGNDPTWQENFNNFIAAMVFSREHADFNRCYKKLQHLTEQILSNVVFT